MNKETVRNIYLGLFVSIALVFLIIAVYYIGSKKNLFSSNIKIYTVFSNVNGLQTGNNIRFLGIDIGTVKNIMVISDTEIVVMAVIEKKYQPFIKRNATAFIGTDGLMGNKIINIRNGDAGSEEVAGFDTLAAVSPVETDEIMKTLRVSSENVKEITEDLKKITRKIDSNNSLWKLLSDTIAAENLKQAIVNIRLTSSNTAVLSGDLHKIAEDIKSGKGSIGVLLTDTSLSGKLKQTIVDISLISDTIAMVSGDLKSITGKVNSGEGAMGTLLMDTNFVHSLNESIENIRQGSQGFNENMEALKHNVLLRRYFKKQKERNP